MPVSTRSKITTQNDLNPSMQQQQQQQQQLRNPHHGLKEKLKTLTLLYEQQKQASKSLTAMRDRNSITSNPNSSTVTKTFVLPQPPSSINDDAKENHNLIAGSDRIVGFTYPRKVSSTSTTTNSVPPSNLNSKNTNSAAVARRLSMPAAATVKGKEEELGKCVSRIMVFVRVRPMNKKEKELSSRCCVRIVNNRDVYLTEFANENDYLRLNRVKGRHFTFDASFTDSATQEQVYSTTTSELVEAVLQGRNGSVFCYGATGAGKTYTMLGTMENPGVMVLAIKDLFSKIRQRSFDGSHVVHLSYLEVYNETVRDLLCPGRPLVLREDKQGIVAAGLTQYRASSADEVMTLLQQGNRNRTTEPTRVNETSSRSHAILQVVVEYRVRDAATMNIVNRVGKLSLIDLAGSERALATDQRTLRSLEGANINRSLLALSSCINALVEGKKHIPYRNSKLTQLLKDSLGGSCNTVMIANISPSSLSFGETQNTVHWADRAKEIRLKVSDINEDELPMPETETDQAKLVHELQKENREIRMQLARQQQKLLTLEAQSLASHSSSTPPPATLSTTPTSTQPSEKRRTRSSFLAGTCFTPETKKKGAELAVRTLQRTVKALEAEIERMKKDHSLQLKQKDDVIRELTQKCGKQALTNGEVGKRVVTGAASLQEKEPKNGELKSHHRLRSPAPTAKKRSFWDITTNSSPSVTTLNGRKTRSHVLSELTAPPPPSMLLQPGFARQKANS